MLKTNSISLHLLLALFSCTAAAQIASDTVCLGDTSVVKYFVSNPEDGVQYNWALEDGGTVISETNDTLFVKWGSIPGLYRISLNTSNSFGCSGEEAEYWILVQETPSLNLKPENAIICVGESVTVRASGADSYSWVPSDGLTLTDADSTIAAPQTTTTYTVTGTIGSCTASKSFTVETADKPEAGFTFEQTGNYFLQFTNNSSGATSFFWDFGPDNTSSEENPLAEFPFDGIYTVSLIVENSCGRDTLTQTIDVIKLGFSDITGTQVYLGPNPVEDKLWIKLSMNRPEPLRIQLFNMLGQQLYDEQLAGKPEIILPVNMALFSDGVYHLKLTQANERIAYKVVKH